MKAEPKVASLEPCQKLAEKLAELGVRVESYFVHAKTEGVIAIAPRWYLNEEIESCHYRIVAPAWTVGELGELLQLVDKGIALPRRNTAGEWYNNRGVLDADTEADARILMLIEEGHITVEEING